MKAIFLLAEGLVAIFLLPLLASAGPMQITFQCGPPIDVTVVDNMDGDTDATAGTILFDKAPAGCKIKGKLVEKITDTSASLTLTEFEIERTGEMAQPTPLHAQTRPFGPFKAPVFAQAFLSGTFVNAGTAGGPSVDLSGEASGIPINGLLFATFPPAAFDKKTEVVKLDNDVSMLELLMTFGLPDIGDKVILPGSAEANAVIATPASLWLLGIGLLGLWGVRARDGTVAMA